MTVITKVQRWSPDTCGCVIEQAVDYDEQGNVVKEPYFLMMNTICDKHRRFASTRFKPNHAQLSAHVISLIEQAKASNLRQVDDQIAKATRTLDRMDLARCRQQVIEFNNRLDIEWGELVQPAHAFDYHIHDKVLVENRTKNANQTSTT